MADDGKELTPLEIPIRVNLSEMEAGLISAGSELRNKIKDFEKAEDELKRHTNEQLAGMKALPNSIKGIELRIQELNARIKTHGAMVSGLNTRYNEKLKTEKADSAEMRQLHKNLDQAVDKTNRYRIELTRLTDQRERAIGREKQEADALAQLAAKEKAAAEAKLKQGSLSGIASSAIQGLQTGGLTGGINGLTTGITAAASAHPIAAGAIVGLGIVKQVGEEAMSSAKELESFYGHLSKLGTNLGITAQEAYKLKTTAELGGGDIETLIPLVNRLSREVLNAGANGNETTKALQKFGVSLTDADGNLLPATEIINNLANGYNTASKSGQGAAFTAQILGKQGAELVTVLKNWSQAAKDASEVNLDLNLNPDEIKEAVKTMRQYNAEWTTLKANIEAALIPMVKWINTRAKETLHDINSNDPYKVMPRWASETANPNRRVYEEGDGQKIEEKSSDPLRAIKGDLSRDQAAAKGTKEREVAVKKLSDAQKEQMKLEAEAFKMSHTDIINSMMDLEVKARLLKDKGVQETAIAKYVQAEKAKIIQDFTRETTDKMNQLYQTALDKRLADIKKEEEAYRAKGAAEVETVKWAEEAKRQALADSAKQALLNDRKRFDSFRKAWSADNASKTGSGTVSIRNPDGTITTRDIRNTGPSGGTVTMKNPDGTVTTKQIGSDNSSAIERWEKAQVYDLQKNKYHNLGDEPMSPEMIKAFERSLKSVEDQAVPIAGFPAGNATKIINNKPNINITVERPVVADPTFINEIAGKVADIITPKMVEALGGGGNSY